MEKEINEIKIIDAEIDKLIAKKTKIILSNKNDILFKELQSYKLEFKKMISIASKLIDQTRIVLEK